MTQDQDDEKRKGEGNDSEVKGSERMRSWNTSEEIISMWMKWSIMSNDSV